MRKARTWSVRVKQVKDQAQPHMQCDGHDASNTASPSGHHDRAAKRPLSELNTLQSKT